MSSLTRLELTVVFSESCDVRHDLEVHHQHPAIVIVAMIFTLTHHIRYVTNTTQEASHMFIKKH